MGNIEATDTAIIIFKKSDDTVVLGSATIDAENSIIAYDLHTQCLTATGIVTCCVQIQRDSEVLTTSENFYYYVEEASRSQPYRHSTKRFPEGPGLRDVPGPVFDL